MSTVGIGLVVLGVMLLFKILISAGRIAFNSVRRVQLKEEAEAGDLAAQRVLLILENSREASAALQLSAILASFAAAAILALFVLPPLVGLLPAALSPAAYTLAAVLVVGVLWYVFSEVVAEFVAQRDTHSVAKRLSGFVRLINIITSPVVWVTTTLRNMSFSGEKAADAHFTEEEIMELVEAGEEEGVIDLQEREMISRVFQLDETVAREIMIPRIDVIALEVNTPLNEARQIIIQEGHSRIPVYTESLDRVEGLLYAKDLLEVWERGETPPSLKPLLRTPVFVPETQSVSDLLQELQNQAVHLAIVVDEYGGTAGLVTIEDIVEEIVGEILDEYDEGEEAAYEQISETEYIFDARIDLDDFERMLDVRVPTEHGEETLGGLIYGRLGKIPDAGESITTEQLEMSVLSVVDKRIKKVRVTLKEPEAQNPSPEEAEPDDAD
jgi:CBS domain containing-hemolysin-like protein